VLSVTPQVYESGRPGSNGPLRSGAPVLFPMSYVRVHTPDWIRTSVLRPRKAVLGSAELRAFDAEPPAGVEPTPRPYEGRVLPLTLRRPDGDGGNRTHALLGASERRSQSASPGFPQPSGFASVKPDSAKIPKARLLGSRGRCDGRSSRWAGGAMRTGGVEPPQPEATRLQRAELAGAQRPQSECGRRDLLPSAGAERCSSASGAIRCLSARLPATTVDRQGHAPPP
jgi:hypothetical protein